MIPRFAARRVRRFVVVALCLLGVSEVVARLVIGLGDPPLSVSDPDIEYMFRPSQTYRRFHNTIRYNSHSMRSREIDAARGRSDELRVLVLGDSVVNGGAMTDDSELATTLLEQRLASRTGRPVFVGNVSAGSWGPPNLLAYLRTRGSFDANVFVLVVSSHDAADVPRFEPVVGVRPEFPAVSPRTALGELVSRYLVPRVTAMLRPPRRQLDTPQRADIDASLGAVCGIVRIGRASSAAVILAQHWTRSEAQGSPEEGWRLLQERARDCGASAVVQLGPEFRAALSRGERPYVDDVHTSALGQRLIADVLEREVYRLLLAAR